MLGKLGLLLYSKHSTQLKCTMDKIVTSFKSSQPTHSALKWIYPAFHLMCPVMLNVPFWFKSGKSCGCLELLLEPDAVHLQDMPPHSSSGLKKCVKWSHSSFQNRFLIHFLAKKTQPIENIISSLKLTIYYFFHKISWFICGVITVNQGITVQSVRNFYNLLEIITFKNYYSGSLLNINFGSTLGFVLFWFCWFGGRGERFPQGFALKWWDIFKNVIWIGKVLYLRSTTQRLKSSESLLLITSAKQCWQVRDGGKCPYKKKRETLQILKAQLNLRGKWT